MEQENQETKEELKQELERVNTEIGNYPSPITGCDDQFNYLLEMRSKMEKRIRELSKRSDIKILGRRESLLRRTCTPIITVNE